MPTRATKIAIPKTRARFILESSNKTGCLRETVSTLSRPSRSPRADGRHLNPLGGVHGGFAATVLDSVTGCAVHTMLEAGVGYGTVDLHVKMLRPVPRDVDLVAEGRVINLSKNLGVAEGTLKTPDGKLLAHASATCMIQRPTPAQA